jgi:molybdenum-dependent DNA-binding transcriptional regulator ModE
MNDQMTTPYSLSDLKLLSHIATTGSYRGASRITGLAHTTISRRIRRLESNLGIPVIQSNANKVILTPWANRLVQSCDAQIARLADTIQEAQTEFIQTSTIGIDEALLDMAPELFAVIETFKQTHMGTIISPKPRSQSTIRWESSVSDDDHGLVARIQTSWAVFAHRDIRYDVQQYPLFKTPIAPQISKLQLANYNAIELVSTCSQALQLALHCQGMALLPVHLADSQEFLTEVTVERERVIEHSLLTLESDVKDSVIHLNLFELLVSQCRQH